MFFALATPCLQACINSETDKPVIFTRVANPFLVGVVEDVDEQQQNVTGISTRSAFQQTIAIIKQLMPKIKVIGTVWSPSEINSEYYLELQKEFAEAAGWEVKSVPINSSSEMKIAVQSLVNEGIDCFYQLFDNLTSLGLESEISIANEEKIPLFSNVISDVFRGAAVSVGWDWYDSGYKAGEIAVQVYHGQKPNEIPIENMKNVKIYINKTAADIQGLKISDEFLKSADKVIQ
jgi:putative tryptophan/tyrosine transport system substrate-binding protein